jgi:cysteine-rich repeat protein
LIAAVSSSNACAADAAGACAGVPVECGDGTLQTSCGEQCDDGNTTSGDGCSSTCMLEPCGPLPETGCRASAPRRALLGLTDRSPDDGDRLLWKWVNGAVMPRADFGDPSSTTSYQLCVYDETGGTPRLVLGTAAPAGGTCRGRPCWRATSTGFKYADPELTPDGLFRILLREGLVPGKGKILVKGRGPNLGLPALPLAQDPAVTVQLKSSDGPCWEARYAAPALRNTQAQFKDRTD